VAVPRQLGAVKAKPATRQWPIQRFEALHPLGIVEDQPVPAAVLGRRLGIGDVIRGRARKLAEQRGDSRRQFMALYGLWQSANGAGMIRECRRLSDGLLQLTAGKSDEGLHLQAHHSAWATAMFAALGRKTSSPSCGRPGHAARIARSAMSERNAIKTGEAFASRCYGLIRDPIG